MGIYPTTKLERRLPIRVWYLPTRSLDRVHGSQSQLRLLQDSLVFFSKRLSCANKLRPFNKDAYITISTAVSGSPNQSHLNVTMVKRSQFPSCTSTTHDKYHGKNTSSRLSRNPGIEYKLSYDARSDHDQLQKLKELFERNADLLTPKYRDTIDSTLFKYGAIRDQIQQDPRIGLVLSVDFDNAPTHQLFSAVSVEVVDQNSATRSKDNSDEDECDKENLQPSDASHPLVDYGEHLSQTETSVTVGSSGITSDKDSDIHNKDDKETTCDQYDTPFDVNAEQNLDLFQTKITKENPVHETKVTRPTVPAVNVLKMAEQLLSKPELTMSAIIEIAMIEPHSIASSDRRENYGPAPSSRYNLDAYNQPLLHSESSLTRSILSMACDEHIDASPSPQIHNTVLSNKSCDTVQGQSSLKSLVPEDSASNIVAPIKHKSPSQRMRSSAMEQPCLGYDAGDYLRHTPERLHDDVEEWLEQVESERDPATADKTHEKTVAAPSFFAWMEEDCVAAYVMDISMVVALSAAAIAGYMNQ